MSNNNFIIDGSISFSNSNIPTRSGQRISSLLELETIPTPSVGMLIYVEDQNKFIYPTSLKSKKVGKLEISDATIAQYEDLIPEELLTKVDNHQTELLVLKGDGEGSIKYQIDLAINDFASKISDNNVVDTFKELIDYAADHSSDLIITVQELEMKNIEQDEKISQLEQKVGDHDTTFQDYSKTISIIENNIDQIENALSWEEVTN